MSNDGNDTATPLAAASASLMSQAIPLSQFRAHDTIEVAVSLPSSGAERDRIEGIDVYEFRGIWQQKGVNIILAGVNSIAVIEGIVRNIDAGRCYKHCVSLIKRGSEDKRGPLDLAWGRIHGQRPGTVSLGPGVNSASKLLSAIKKHATTKTCEPPKHDSEVSRTLVIIDGWKVVNHESDALKEAWNDFSYHSIDVLWRIDYSIPRNRMPFVETIDYVFAVKGTYMRNPNCFFEKQPLKCVWNRARLQHSNKNARDVLEVLLTGRRTVAVIDARTWILHYWTMNRKIYESKSIKSSKLDVIMGASGNHGLVIPIEFIESEDEGDIESESGSESESGDQKVDETTRENDNNNNNNNNNNENRDDGYHQEKNDRDDNHGGANECEYKHENCPTKTTNEYEHERGCKRECSTNNAGDGDGDGANIIKDNDNDDNNNHGDKPDQINCDKSGDALITVTATATITTITDGTDAAAVAATLTATSIIVDAGAVDSNNGGDGSNRNVDNENGNDSNKAAPNSHTVVDNDNNDALTSNAQTATDAPHDKATINDSENHLELRDTNAFGTRSIDIASKRDPEVARTDVNSIRVLNDGNGDGDRPYQCGEEICSRNANVNEDYDSNSNSNSSNNNDNDNKDDPVNIVGESEPAPKHELARPLSSPASSVTPLSLQDPPSLLMSETRDAPVRDKSLWSLLDPAIVSAGLLVALDGAESTAPVTTTTGATISSSKTAAASAEKTPTVHVAVSAEMAVPELLNRAELVVAEISTMMPIPCEAGVSEAKKENWGSQDSPIASPGPILVPVLHDSYEISEPRYLTGPPPGFKPRRYSQMRNGYRENWARKSDSDGDGEGDRSAGYATRHQFHNIDPFRNRNRTSTPRRTAGYSRQRAHARACESEDGVKTASAEVGANADINAYEKNSKDLECDHTNEQDIQYRGNRDVSRHYGRHDHPSFRGHGRKNKNRWYNKNRKRYPNPGYVDLDAPVEPGQSNDNAPSVDPRVDCAIRQPAKPPSRKGKAFAIRDQNHYHDRDDDNDNNNNDGVSSSNRGVRNSAAVVIADNKEASYSGSNSNDVRLKPWKEAAFKKKHPQHERQDPELGHPSRQKQNHYQHRSHYNRKQKHKGGAEPSLQQHHYHQHHQSDDPKYDRDSNHGDGYDYDHDYGHGYDHDYEYDYQQQQHPYQYPLPYQHSYPLYPHPSYPYPHPSYLYPHPQPQSESQPQSQLQLQSQPQSQAYLDPSSHSYSDAHQYANSYAYSRPHHHRHHNHHGHQHYKEQRQGRRSRSYSSDTNQHETHQRGYYQYCQEPEYPLQWNPVPHGNDTLDPKNNYGAEAGFGVNADNAAEVHTSFPVDGSAAVTGIKRDPSRHFSSHQTATDAGDKVDNDDDHLRESFCVIVYYRAPDGEFHEVRRVQCDSEQQTVASIAARVSIEVSKHEPSLKPFRVNIATNEGTMLCGQSCINAINGSLRLREAVLSSGRVIWRSTRIIDHISAYID